MSAILALLLAGALLFTILLAWTSWSYYRYCQSHRHERDQCQLSTAQKYHTYPSPDPRPAQFSYSYPFPPTIPQRANPRSKVKPGRACETVTPNTAPAPAWRADRDAGFSSSNSSSPSTRSYDRSMPAQEHGVVALGGTVTVPERAHTKPSPAYPASTAAPTWALPSYSTTLARPSRFREVMSGDLREAAKWRDGPFD